MSLASTDADGNKLGCGVNSSATLTVCANGLNSAPGPDMSRICSRKWVCSPGTGSVTSSTATPPSRCVRPSPTVVGAVTNPGNTPPGPSTFQRGSTASLALMIRTISPGRARCTRTPAKCDSSSTSRRTSSLLTTRVAVSTPVRAPNSMRLIWNDPTSSRITILPNLSPSTPHGTVPLNSKPKIQDPYTLSLGSIASLSASPNKLMPSTVRMIASPGNRPSHHALVRYSLPWLSIPPQLGVGGCTPNPRKLSDDSAMINSAS